MTADGARANDGEGAPARWRARLAARPRRDRIAKETRADDASPAASHPLDRSGSQAAARRRRKSSRGFSHLTQIIFTLNTVALALLVVALIMADQSRTRLIEARKQALASQGELIAGAIAESAVRDDTEAREVIAGVETQIPLLDSDEASRIIRRLVLPLNTRARLYDFRGRLVVDSKLLMSGGSIDRIELEPPAAPEPVDLWIGRAYDWIENIFPRSERLPYLEAPPDRGPETYSELAAALTGRTAGYDRYKDGRELIVSVAIPIQKLKVTLGAILLTTEGQDIDAIIRQDNETIFSIVLITFVVSLLLSWMLSRMIAGPIRRLAEAADEAAFGPAGARVPIPDLGNRQDEIGDLSQSLRAMTRALYDRIEAIERFAADVSHEIKNPLTSIKSAVETLVRAKRPEDQARLTAIILDDVRRLDRLITDISDASRLDAELARGRLELLSLGKLVSTFVDTYESTRSPGDARLVLKVELGANDPAEAQIKGHETRLAQVLHNLVANARSFSPADGAITLTVSATQGTKPSLLLTVDDEGPGIPEENLETIFDRFYTSRPNQDFGKNSGLGLSISRQIIEAHNGRIWAENRKGEGGQTIGARFSVRLPLAQGDE